MVRIFGNFYVLDTNNTTYAFMANKAGHLEHLYYGKKIRLEQESDFLPLVEKQGCAPGASCLYEGRGANGDIVTAGYTLDDIRLEMSSYGKGDQREPFIEVVHDDGSFTSDFLFESAEILSKKPEYGSMPSSYFDESSTSDSATDNVLSVVLRDYQYDLRLEIVYTVFESVNIITRMTKLTNTSQKPVTLKRLMSTQLDLVGCGYDFHTFTGAWTREMHKTCTKVSSGKMVNSAYCGITSPRANPFVMISSDGAGQMQGDVYAINLVYSGNHYEALEVGIYSNTRFIAGINPQSFAYEIKPGDLFEAPEAVMTFSGEGFNGISANMHRFVNNNIVRGAFKNAPRPILLNSWEACYFDIDEDKLLGLAKKATEAGIELFVMDDGWFGNRNDDSSSLGDWKVNRSKLPGGIEGLAKKINALGIKFGLWVEPEMINVDSNLYRQHPDWAVQIEGAPHSEGRNQRILDITRKEVRDYIINSMREVFSAEGVSYIKWDMNRVFTDVYSAQLPANRQGEVLHRYVLGLYEILETLIKEFPDILVEGCSSGGSRFDLGVLCYYPQIWASDDTDAYERVMIQNGYSYGYPQSCYTNHLSDVPNHQTHRVTPFETRFNVAAFGNLGYECNLLKLSEEEFAAVKEQVEFYKEHRMTLQYGQLYRVSSIPECNKTEWTIVSEDRSEALSLVMQNRTVPNKSMQTIRPAGLDPDCKYEISNRKLKYTQCENDTARAYGDTLMNAGMFVTQGFVGTGYNENVKDMQDLGSRIYTLKKV